MKRIRSDSSTILPSPHTPGVGLQAVGARRERVEVNMWRTLAPYARRAGYRTQAQLAKALGLTREHINRVCRGQVYFTEDLEHRLTFLLRLTPAECNAAFGYPGAKPHREAPIRELVLR